MTKSIQSAGVVAKEFFKLFEEYILKAEVKLFCGIISELNESRSKTKDSDFYEFMCSVNPSCLSVAPRRYL